MMSCGISTETMLVIPGGVSVHSLLTIPAAKGLFHKTIGNSSGGRDGGAYRKTYP